MKISLRHRVYPWLVLWKSRQKSMIRTNFCNYPQHPCCLDILDEYNQNKHGQGMMIVLPNQRLSKVLSTLHCIQIWFLSCHFCHPHAQTRIAFFSVYECMWKFSQTVFWKALSRIAVPAIFLPKDDRTDFVHEEQLGLPYWTMILAICVSVDISKYMDILSLEYSISSVWADTASAACPGSLEIMSMTCAAVIWDADDPCSVNTA